MNASFLQAVTIALSGLAAAATASDQPPTCTVHFFDWYAISSPAQLTEVQKRWTYPIDWQSLDIAPPDIGNTVHYYEVQCQKIRDAGFDGLHYEWHGNPVKPVFVEALQKTQMPMAMFYDMEIRFNGQGAFITPTDQFAAKFVADVVEFYGSVPKSLWLHDRHGRLPIVVYGYAFDTRVTDPAVWDHFYRTIISGVQQQLGEQVVFHWTNNGTFQQLYGYQHFPEIQSYVFNEATQQSPVNAHCVTFVVHYDDLGVSFTRSGPRPTRWIRNDIRYLEEALGLALATNPDLVFNYGWNELYEGEHLLPDRLWGSWRCEAAGGIVQHIKAQAKRATAEPQPPRWLVIVDDFLPAFHNATPEKIGELQREMRLLNRLRSLAPRADVVLSGSKTPLADYAAICCLNSVKDRAEEETLAACKQPVIYVNQRADSQTPMTARFTSAARKPLPRAVAGPENEYVVLSRDVNIDLGKFPLLEFRCRNTPNTTFDIRYRGVTASGREADAWLETSDTDDRQSNGKWLEAQANVAQIAQQAAGEPIVRLTHMDVILDDLELNGQFALDIDYLRFVNAAGEKGWEESFDAPNDWSVHSTVEGVPGGNERFAFSVRKEGEATMGHIDLQAVVSSVLPGSLDPSSLMIEPSAGVAVLATEAFEGTQVPVLLQRDRTCWLNTCQPSDKCWETLFHELFALPLHLGVSFRSYSHSVTRDGITSNRETAAMVIPSAPLPLSRIRLVAPPELNQPLPQTLPLGYERMRLQVVAGQRQQIPYPDADSNPPTITLQPGEVVEFVRE